MQVRIGIFICNCGKSLNNIDFPKVKERVEKFQDVVYVDLRSKSMAFVGQLSLQRLQSSPLTRRQQVSSRT